jgi:DNA mismatch repair protein MutL
VSGYASAPSLHRSNRKEITLFVNGRWVQDQSLTFAVIQAYHTLLMSKRFPLAVVKVQLLPEDVDVNVHPAKTQVRFRDGDAVFRAVQRAVRRALLDQSPAPEVEAEVSAQDTPAWPGAWPTPEQVARRAQLRSIGAASARRFEPAEPVQFALPRVEARVEVEAGGEDEAEAEVEAKVEDAAPAARSLPVLHVIGQVGLTYIVAEGPEGMFLIDQHAAHERILYEKFMAERTTAQVVSQPLLEPLTVELTPEGASLVEDNLEALLALGFDLQPFGGSTALLRAVPAMLAGDNMQAIFNEIVADLQVGAEPLAGELEARLVRRVCKWAAIKGGQHLSRQEMDELIRQLENCAAPHTCPHGRPTMIHLSANQLAREFGRLG